MPLPPSPFPTNRDVFLQALETAKQKYLDSVADGKIVADEVKRLRGQMEIDKAQRDDQDLADTELLNKLWGLLYPEQPEGWEYPGMVINHLRIALDQLRQSEAQAHELLEKAWYKADWEVYLKADGTLGIEDALIAEVLAYLWPQGRPGPVQGG